MSKSIILVKPDNQPEHIYSELVKLSSLLADEQLQYIGNAFKSKVSELPTPLNDDYFKDPDVETLCRVVDGNIVSFVGIKHICGMIGIDYIFTLPEYRRNGYVTELFDYLFKMYNKKDHYFFLIAYVKNTEAVKLYKKIGFTSNYVTMEL